MYSETESCVLVEVTTNKRILCTSFVFLKALAEFYLFKALASECQHPAGCSYIPNAAKGWIANVHLSVYGRVVGQRQCCGPEKSMVCYCKPCGQRTSTNPIESWSLHEASHHMTEECSQCAANHAISGAIKTQPRSDQKFNVNVLCVHHRALNQKFLELKMRKVNKRPPPNTNVSK